MLKSGDESIANALEIGEFQAGIHNALIVGGLGNGIKSRFASGCVDRKATRKNKRPDVPQLGNIDVRTLAFGSRAVDTRLTIGA